MELNLNPHLPSLVSWLAHVMTKPKIWEQLPGIHITSHAVKAVTNISHLGSDLDTSRYCTLDRIHPIGVVCSTLKILDVRDSGIMHIILENYAQHF